MMPVRTHLQLILTFAFYFLLLVVICWGTDWGFAQLKSKGWQLTFDATRVSQLLASTLTLWVAFRQRVRQPPTILVRDLGAAAWQVNLLVTVNCERSSSVAIHDVEVADFERLSPALIAEFTIPAGETRQMTLGFRANDTARERVQRKFLLRVLVQMEELQRGRLRSKCLRMWNPLRKGNSL